jgi:hypothetical protein
MANVLKKFAKKGEIPGVRPEEHFRAGTLGSNKLRFSGSKLGIIIGAFYRF